MKMKNLIAFATLSLAALAFGADAEGNIRSIDAVPDYGQTILYPNKNSPLKAGQTLYILVRLLNEDWPLTQGGGANYPWYFRRRADNMGSTALDEYDQYKPALGISIGGRTEMAVYSTKGPNGEESGPNADCSWYTDFYFAYTVKPGDLGLPIKLLNQKGQIPQTTGDNFDFKLYNVNTAGADRNAYWDLTNDCAGEGEDRHLAGFHYGPSNYDEGDPSYPKSPHEKPHRSYDFAEDGIYVQTIDFDGTYADEESNPKVWREVHLDGGAEGERPSVVADGDATVYVWSEDDSIAVVEPDGPNTEYYDDGTGKKLLKVTVSGGATTFRIRGKGAVGSTVKIYMSSGTSESYSLVGDKLENSVVERTVRIIDREKPSLELFTVVAGQETSKPALTYATTAYENDWMLVTLRSNSDIPAEYLPLTVDLDLQVKDVPLADLNPANGYVKVLQEEGDPTVLPGTNRVTIAAGRQVSFYVYKLGSCKETKSNGILITPRVTGAAAGFFTGRMTPITIKLDDQAPEIVQPAEGAEFNASEGAPIEDFNVEVNDNWRDLQSSLATNGYTVTVAFAGGGSFTTNEVHFLSDTSIALPLVAPNSGSYDAVVRVKDPAGHVSTRTVKINANPRPRARAQFYGDAAMTKPLGGNTFSEGQVPYVGIVFTEGKAPADMYAFLVPQNANATNLVVCNAMTNGLRIAQGDTNTTVAAMSFLDGYSVLRPMNARFKVVFKSVPEFADLAALLADRSAVDYSADCGNPAFEVNVVNETPTVKPGSMELSGTTVDDGGTLGNKAPMGSQVTFSAVVQDASPIDLAATNEQQVILAKWVWTDGIGDEKGEHWKITKAVKKHISCPVTFGYEGQKQTVKVYLVDKDDRAGVTDEDDIDWPSTPAYTFYVNVTASAKVEILDQKQCLVTNNTVIFSEDWTKSKAYFYVRLSQSPTGYADGSLPISAQNPIKVRLTKENWGSDGNMDFENEIVELTDTQPKKVYLNVDTLNGGADTLYNVYATVITDSCSNQYGVAWSNYYTAASAEMGVENISPTIGSVKRTNGSFSDFGTNRWSAGEAVALTWTVRDILPDLTNGMFSLTWSHDPSGGYTNPQLITNVIVGTGRIRSTSGAYEFTVPDVRDQRLTLTVEDGDGGVATKEWVIYVAPSKRIKVNVLGPSAVSETKYGTAAGLGRGAVGAKGTSVSPISESFVQTWSYSEAAASAELYAWGYPSVDMNSPADVDNALDKGNMPTKAGSSATGVALTPSGGKWTGGDYYNYATDGGRDPNAGLYDNFFYRWVVVSTGDKKGQGEGGNSGQDSDGDAIKPSPSPTPLNNTTKAIPLADGKDGAYGLVEVDAVFARELYPHDNMGDINADGIPDLFVRFYGLGADTAGTFPEDDLQKFGGFNDDGDFLPAMETSQYGAFIPDLSNTWVTTGTPFDARTEIRGYHRDFNDGPTQSGVRGASPDRVYAVTTDSGEVAWNEAKCTISELEFIAFTNWCARQATPLDPKAVQNWTKWSPERPTDPTVADTDEDGMPDGYEYFFWYKAHVGYLEADGTYRRMTGRRFVPTDPANPTVIPADDIEKRMDPRDPGDESSVNTRDSDNDGLIDLVEFELGTNPFDFDTDGDGLPDGYEVMVTKTSPLLYATDKVHPDGTLNTDGDFKAETTVDLNWMDMANAGKPGVTSRYYTVEAPAFTNVETVAGGVTTTNRQVLSHGELVTIWRYGVGDPKAPWALGGTNQTSSVTGATWTVIATGVEKGVKVLHYQVFRKDGFDPRVGWNDPNAAKKGHCVTTTPFTALDEFLVMAFYYNNNGLKAEDLAVKSPEDWQTKWTSYCTSPLTADTDGDGMPDGWELYVQNGGKGAAGPGPDSGYSPISDFGKVSGAARDPDRFPNGGDGLHFVEEFAGIESVGRYSATCETIRLTTDQARWQNKWWPTDPYNADTDGDGIEDGAERVFLYGGARKGAIDDEGCIAGGGLNPLSWDTDKDGLPDPFELEFIGAGAWIADSQAAAGDTASSTNGVETGTSPDPTAGRWNDLGMDGTVDDAKKDYDHDGLANWQEYMTGAMRCWRYDDTISHWNDGAFDPVAGGDNQYRYFSLATNAFEQDAWVSNPSVYNNYYMFRDGHYHDLKGGAKNPFTEKDDGVGDYSLVNSDGTAIYPHKYICTSPVKHDTDEDGMDDYYELFHGLNPLLGEAGTTVSGTHPCDIVFESYRQDTLPWNAVANYWVEGDKAKNLTRPETPLRVTKLSKDCNYDFFQYPWLAGLLGADPDGDNIRNLSEAIMPGVQAASTYLHTDPTPLWMTDSSFGASLVTRYYYLPKESSVKPAPSTITRRWMGGYAARTMFSYEENEGYDSDHDFLGDAEETRGKAKPASDPQDHDDPRRRQAMWFNGTDAFLQSTLPEFEQRPNESGVSMVGRNYLYFTVECWAKPDAVTIMNEQTLVERSIWTGPAGAADEKYLRKNFLIGIRNGRWYAMFDTDGVDAKQQVEITNGPEVTTTNWTYIAFTYGPENGDQNDPEQKMRPRLYVNGVACAGDPVGVHPEHGVSALVLSKVNEEDGYEYWTSDLGRMISFTVGASAETQAGICFDLGYRLGVAGTTLRDYGRFYRGYIDEVRIWDGARPAKDIQDDFENRTRYDSAKAEENRARFRADWENGGLRTPESSVNLAARLMHHWSFDHLAGAVEPKDLIDVPAGFRTGDDVTDGMAIWARPVGWTNNWWNSVRVRSTVYTDTAWVPWINDTVGHLPRPDGTTLDSVYWSADFAGYLSAGAAGYMRFAFPRTAEVPSRWVQQEYGFAAPNYTQSTRYDLISTNETLYADYRFTMLDRQTAGFDLLPMGGAYPRRISAAEGGMWDRNGAADAWAENGTDADHNSLPDWWEEYARANYAEGLSPWEVFGWGTTVNYHGVNMPAWQAYLRDLARGLLPDGEIHPEFADTRDLDEDGLPDWWAEMYGVVGADADPDGDGLSNYAEYLIGEVFKFRTPCDPTKYATDGRICDYFFKVGDLYLGEIFTDHDQIDDLWEAAHPEFGANRYVFDPYRDADGNGWDNFSEYHAYVSGRCENTLVGHKTNVTVSAAGVTNVEEVAIYAYDGHPTPAIELTLKFDRALFAADASNATVRVEAYKDLVAPDAIWTVALSAADRRNGLAKVTLKVADSGCVRQGLNTFICYVTGGTAKAGDKANASSYVPGMPFGIARDVDVGWDGAKAEIGLAKTSAITPRIDLWSDVSDRVSTIYEATADFLLGDPLYRERYATNDALRAEFDRILASRVNVVKPEAGKSMRVRVVRYGIDNKFCYVAGVGSQSGLYDQIVVLDKRFDDSCRQFLCEADFLGDGEFDIDWNTLSGTDFREGAVVSSGGTPLGSATMGPKGSGLVVSNMTYLVVIGDGAKDFRDSGDTNTVVNALATMVTRRFEVTRHAPVAENIETIVHGARPTFRWSIPDEEPWAKQFGSSYTAFKLQILAADGATVVYDSGVRRAPVQDANGFFTWTADAFAGDQTALGNIFGAAGNWKWRVAMYNAKFKPQVKSILEKWSNVVPFSTSVGTQQETDDSNYSSIDVVVKYAGPVAVLADSEDVSKTIGKVRIQAFTTADFSGEPVAQGFVANKVALTNTADVTTANGRLIGLPFGTYYVRAYIDSNGNFKKDAWESWGAAKDAVVVKATQRAPFAVLYIEDVDTDQDWLPDAWEYVRYGNLDERGATIDPEGRIVLKTSIYEGLFESADNFSRIASGATLTFFQSVGNAILLLGLGDADVTLAGIEDIRKAIERRIDPTSVKITSLEIDVKNGRADLMVGATTLDPTAGSLLSAVYELPKTTTVTIRVYRKTTLATAEWEPVKTITLVIDSTLSTHIEVPLGADVDLTSGFYKVEIVENGP